MIAKNALEELSSSQTAETFNDSDEIDAQSVDETEDKSNAIGQIIDMLSQQEETEQDELEEECDADDFEEVLDEEETEEELDEEVDEEFEEEEFDEELDEEVEEELDEDNE